jgi:integrase/recombinase XerD
MLNEWTFLLPPMAPQEMPLPEAFDRAQRVSEEWQSNTRAKKRKKRRQAAPKEVSVLVEEFLHELETERSLSANVLNAYAKDLQIYVAWLQAQGIQLRHVAAAQVESYRRDLRGGQIHRIVPAKRRPAPHAKFYAAPTLARKLATVRDWHGFLAREYGWPDPTAHLETTTPSIESGPPRTRLVLSLEQIHALLRAPNRSQPLGKRDRAILYLLCEGFSASEIGALRCDREWDNGLILGESARAVLREYSEVVRPFLAGRLKKKGRHSLRLFFTTRGTPLSPTAIHQIVRRYAEAAHLPVWVSSTNLATSSALQRNGRENTAVLPRATQLRHAYEKAHPRS